MPPGKSHDIVGEGELLSQAYCLCKLMIPKCDTEQQETFSLDLGIALHDRVTVAASRHSGMFPAGIQKSFLDSDLR